MRLAVALGLCLVVHPVMANEASPEQVVHRLFDAMRAGNGAAVLDLVQPDAPLERLMPDGTIKKGSFVKWASWIDTLAPGDADEQIFGVTSFHSAPGLATVSAPFMVYLHGELVGCGVNQFNFARVTEGWRIIHGIDVPHDGDCATFRDDYMAKAKSTP